MMFKVTGMKSAKGQIFIITLIIMAVGLIVISPMLSYLDSSSQQYTKDLLKTSAYYAVDAMMENILNDLYRGVNIYDYNGSTPYEQENFLESGFDVSVVVNDSMPQPLPTPEGGSGWLYLDPGVSICADSSCNTSLLLGSLANGATHNHTIYLVNGTTIQVNWAQDDPDGDCFECWYAFLTYGCDPTPVGRYKLNASMWMLYENGSTKVAGTWKNGSSLTTPLYLNFSWLVTETGNYTIQFQNKGCYRSDYNQWTCAASGNNSRASYSASFGGLDDSTYTWIRVGVVGEDGAVYSHQDYSITAIASRNGEDIVGITAYIRHSPGPLCAWKPQTVEIPSWQVTYY